jgi:hypothetical protein
MGLWLSPDAPVPPMLDAADYLLGVAALAIALGSLFLGGSRLRGRLLNGWSGPPAYLADAVLSLALLILIAELLGAVAVLERWPLVAACLVVGVGLRLVVRRPRHGAGQPPPAPASGVWGLGVAALIAAAVVAHWSIGTVGAFGAGMTGYDSVWYHMPFAANFAQTGSTLDFAFVAPRYLSWFYPQNSELLHGVGMLLTQRDVLSPALNLVWLVGCLGAAWCIGRPYGMGPWTVAAAAVVLDAGVMADQAGEARNDTVALFFLLAAVAFLINGAAAGRGRGPGLGALAVAGTAAGLAAGTKLSFLLPAAVFAAGTPFLASSGRRRAAALWFAAPMLAGCGFWYLRNVAEAGNPFPWFKAIGPLQLPGPEQGLGGRPQFSVVHYVGDGGVWNDWFEPALSNRLGELWPLLLAISVAAIVFCLLRAPPTLKLIGLAALAWIPVYLVDGTSAEGPAGTPVGFASSLRHLLPSLALALVLVPLVADRWSRRGRTAVALLIATLLVAADMSGQPWPRNYVFLAALLGAVGLSAVAVWESDPRHAFPRPAVATACTAAIGTLVVAGWFLQRSYLRDRYTSGDFRSRGLNAVSAWASDLNDQRIGTSLVLLYPLYGTDLSNRVQYLGMRVPDDGFIRPRSCAEWLHVVNRGNFNYLVVSDGGGAVDRDSSDELGRIPARIVLKRDLVEVFRLGGPLDRSVCSRIAPNSFAVHRSTPRHPSRAHS